MAFRGMFDGSVQIDQAREERAHQAAMQAQQIRAQMQMQQQQIRAQMSMQQNQLSFAGQQADADRAMKAEQFGVTSGLASQEMQLKRQAFGLEQQKFESEQSVRELQQANAKLMLQKAQQEFDDDQAQRASLTAYRQSAFGSGVLSAMLNGVVSTKTLSAINKANGVADGAAGSIVGMGGGPDGAWYDIIAQDEQGKVGKVRQQVDPMAIIALGHSLLGKDGLKEFGAMYRTRDSNNTKMNLALEAAMKAMMVEDARQQKAESVQDLKNKGALAVQGLKNEGAADVQGLRNEGALDVAGRRSAAASLEKLADRYDVLDSEIKAAQKKNQAIDPAKLKTRDDLKVAMDRITADIAGTGSKEDATAPGATPATGNSAKADVNAGTVTVVLEGQTRTVKDSAELRDWLKKRGITVQ